MQGMTFPCKEMVSMEIRVIQLTRLYGDFKMLCGNALKHLKNTQKLLKKLSCHGIRGKALLGLVTGERSGSEEQEKDCISQGKVRCILPECSEKARTQHCVSTSMQDGHQGQ